MSNNRQLAKNASYLYLRMFISMVVGFFTSRVVLQALGVSDFGIYNVVGGVIGMINLLTGALGKATSRFITFALGKGDRLLLQETFSTTVVIHIFIALLFVFLGETVGLWFVNNQLVIPEERMAAANWVYQASIVATFIGLMQVPYIALITAHERFNFYAFLTLFTSFMKLGIAYVVLYSGYDHLVLFCILYTFISLMAQLFAYVYCRKHFSECRIKRQLNKSQFKEMFAYTSWGVLGHVTGNFYQQGISILVNRFFGTLINAAVGVAGQVQGVLYSFSGNVTSAFAPQIIKEYAAKNYNRVNYLIGMGTKFTSLMAVLTTLPIFFSLQFLMSIWLKEVPNGAVTICQIFLMINFFNGFNPFIYMAITASGKIKVVNVSLSLIYVMMLLLIYFSMKFFHSYTFAYLVSALASPATTVLYLITLKKLMPDFNRRQFLMGTYIPMAAIAIIGFCLAFVIKQMVCSQLWSLIFVAIVVVPFVGFSVYFFVLDQYSRGFIKGLLKHKLLFFK